MKYEKKLIYCDTDKSRELTREINKAVTAANEIAQTLNFYGIDATKPLICEMFAMRKATPKCSVLSHPTGAPYSDTIPHTATDHTDTESDYTPTPLFDSAIAAATAKLIDVLPTATERATQQAQNDSEKVKATIYHVLQKRCYNEFNSLFAQRFKRYCTLENGKAVTVSNVKEMITNDVGIFIESEKAAKLMQLHESANNAIQAFLDACNIVGKRLDVTTLFDVYNGQSRAIAINYNKLVK